MKATLAFHQTPGFNVAMSKRMVATCSPLQNIHKFELIPRRHIIWVFQLQPLKGSFAA